MDSQNIGSGLTTQAPNIDQERERLLWPIKEFRQRVDVLIQQVPSGAPHPQEPVQTLRGANYNPAYTEAYGQVRIHLTDAKMWAGKLLEALGNPFPAELADKAEVAR